LEIDYSDSRLPAFRVVYFADEPLMPVDLYPRARRVEIEQAGMRCVEVAIRATAAIDHDRFFGTAGDGVAWKKSF
jgi:hypothetical protein